MISPSSNGRGRVHVRPRRFRRSLALFLAFSLASSSPSLAANQWPFTPYLYVAYINAPFGDTKQCEEHFYGTYATVWFTQAINRYMSSNLPNATCTGAYLPRPVNFVIARSYAWQGSVNVGYQEVGNPANSYLAQANVTYAQTQTSWCTWVFYWKWLEQQYWIGQYLCKPTP